MKLIQPSEVSGRILTLLDESDERLVLVSPYMKIAKWYKFVNKINKLIERGVKLTIYVRDDPDNKATYHDLDQLSLQYTRVPHLHSKLYLNERSGIVTSMNLLLSSEINSLEIGYYTENREDYNDLLGFYHRYIYNGEPVQRNTLAGRPVADVKVVMNRIKDELNRNARSSWTCIAGNQLKISTGRNNYTVSIKDGYLRIAASIKVYSGAMHTSPQQTFLFSKKIAKKVKDLSAMKVDVFPVLTPGIIQLCGQSQQRLQSTCIASILEADVPYLILSTIKFIDATDVLIVQEMP